MFDYLVVTLREGVEAALIVGIVLGYLRKTGREVWARVVYWGLAAACAASLVFGYVLHRVEVKEMGDAYEGALMLLAAVFIASMVYWMWRTGKRLRREIEERISGIAGSPAKGAVLGLFAFVFLMVFREGIEMVLLLAAVSLRTSNELLELIGGVTGLGLAVAFGVAFFKGSLRIDLRRFFNVTTVVLAAIALQLFIAGIHELSEAQVLPSSRREMAIVGPFVNNDLVFFVFIIALCLFLLAAGRMKTPSDDPLAASAAPERRKRLAAARRDRRWKLAATAASLAVVVLISAQFVYSRVAQAIEPPYPLALQNGAGRIPAGALRDHKLHRFIATVPGGQVRLIAIIDPSDTIRVALDACAICGSQGYYQSGHNVICRNCGAAIYIPTIGAAGGCNPIRLDPPYEVTGSTVLIPEAALESGSKYFR